MTTQVVGGPRILSLPTFEQLQHVWAGEEILTFWTRGGGATNAGSAGLDSGGFGGLDDA